MDGCMQFLSAYLSRLSLFLSTLYNRQDARMIREATNNLREPGTSIKRNRPLLTICLKPTKTSNTPGEDHTTELKHRASSPKSILYGRVAVNPRFRCT